MDRDPRNPDERYMVRTSSTHPAHNSLRKTLVLLRIDGKIGPIYFVVEGLNTWPETLDEMIGHARYFYEEHTCPTNFIGVPLISIAGDHDPHGLFKFVDAVWMMDEYKAAAYGSEEEYLLRIFPQIAQEKTIDLKPHRETHLLNTGNSDKPVNE